MQNSILNQEHLVLKILKNLKNLQDLRTATQAWEGFAFVEQKYQLRNQFPNGSCSGCWDNLPIPSNTRAHIESGGCLENLDDHPIDCRCEYCCQASRFWRSYVSPEEFCTGPYRFF